MLSIKRYLRENPIASRLLGLIIVCSSLVTLLAIVAQLRSNYYSDLASLEQRIDQVKVGTLASITKSLWAFDQEQLRVQVQSLLEVEDVVRVSVSWRDWDEQPLQLQVASDAFDSKLLSETPGRFLQREYPLLYSDDGKLHTLGVLSITASLDSIYQRLWQQGIFVVLVQAVKTLLIALFIVWLVYGLLTRHIKTIARYARHLNLDSLNKPLGLQRFKPYGFPDELDDVVNAINQMRQTLLEDIEQRHAIEVALLSEKAEKLETRRLKNAAEEASRAKSQFLATMSHEIRTPMNGVIGMLEMLRDTPLDDNQQHYVDVIHRSGENLLAIINDILDYSKIEAGKMQLETTAFNLEELMAGCLQLFSASADKRGLALLGSVAPDIPANLMGDPTRLRQVIINLLGNAFKFTERGHVRLTLSLVQGDSASDEVVLRIAVQDSGVGVAPECQAALFDSFSQADASTTRKYGGTGLGLAICKSLVQLMGGEIGVNSAPGKGAEFWFTAVFGRAPLAEASAPVKTHSSQAPVLDKFAHLAVLVAEDNQVNRMVIGGLLGKLGITPVMVENGQEALAVVAQRSSPFSLILMDCEMPDMDGFATTRAIRELERARGQQAVAIMALTAHALQESRDAALACGMDAYLAKPITLGSLYAAIDALDIPLHNTKAPQP